MRVNLTSPGNSLTGHPRLRLRLLDGRVLLMTLRERTQDGDLTGWVCGRETTVPVSHLVSVDRVLERVPRQIRGRYVCNLKAFALRNLLSLVRGNLEGLDGYDLSDRSVLCALIEAGCLDNGVEDLKAFVEAKLGGLHLNA